MSKKSTQLKATTAPSTSANPVAPGALIFNNDAPSFGQVYTTLRLCLRYGKSSANIFARLMKILETTNFIPILLLLPEEELLRLLPMISTSLTAIRLEMSEILVLSGFCEKVGVIELPRVTSCDLLPTKLKASAVFNTRNELQILGELLPGLKELNVNGFISGHFPNNLSQLRTLMLRKSTSQSVLDEICAKCVKLQQLYLRNETPPYLTLNVMNIWKCPELREVQLPLMLQKPLALCKLRHLVDLNLQRLQLWPDLEWLPVIRIIIRAKRYELQRLFFDGGWLTTKLDLSVLHLEFCWALESLHLSNCKLADKTTGPTLPLSCQQFSLKGCTMSSILPFLKGNAQLQLLELFDCQLLKGDGQTLLHLLKHRQSIAAVTPLTLRFSQSTPMRTELTRLTRSRRQYWEDWLKIREVRENDVGWKQPLGTISMKFGAPVAHMPDLDKWNDYAQPTPAELLKALGITDKILT